MVNMFVNLKRFDVPTEMGGICPSDNPVSWTEQVISEAANLGIGHMKDVRIALFFPEALLPAAVKAAAKEGTRLGNIAIGSQSVYRDDVKAGGNFGAFTSHLPAAAVRNMGCTWTMIGHSEERKDKWEILAEYDSSLASDRTAMAKGNRVLNSLLNREIHRAYERELNVLYCVGETAEERGDGDFEEQKLRIRAILGEQVKAGLSGVGEYVRKGGELVLAYEPRWAIGPGKTPPGPEYIGFVTKTLKEMVRDELGIDVSVLYGGGLKRENAAPIGGVETVGGGLVALTKFTQPVAFDPSEFKVIIETYLSGM